MVFCLPSQPALSSEHLRNILHFCLETWNQTAEGTWRGKDPVSHLNSLGLLHVPNYTRGWGEEVAGFCLLTYARKSELQENKLLMNRSRAGQYSGHREVLLLPRAQRPSFQWR